MDSLPGTVDLAIDKGTVWVHIAIERQSKKQSVDGQQAVTQELRGGYWIIRL
jgi:hypothetical protein